MPDTNMELQLGKLSDSALQAPLETGAHAWAALLGTRLAGITVVGSCLTADYRAGQSDINTVLLVDAYDPDILTKLASAMRPLRRKQRLAVPLLMTNDYIARSRDVFGIEFLDFQLTHHTILGDDPFAELQFQKTDVRLQCERELKADLIRLRQGYISADAKPVLVQDVLIAAVKSLAPLLRAMLWLHDFSREANLQSTFTQAATQFSFDAQALLDVSTWWRQKARPKGPELRANFDRVYEIIESLAHTVDTFGENA